MDEGLLDLTRFRTPEPWKAFNAREALGVSTWDMYNFVVGAYGGRIEQLFSIGGDDALNKGPKAIVNRFKPVVMFDGPFLLKKGEKKRVSVVLDEDAFSFYDMNQHRFVVEKGDFEILVGPASSQLPLKAMVCLLYTSPSPRD